MAFAPPAKVKSSTNLAKSTWTPMNHPDANNQVFEERRELISKWFKKWHESQKHVIVDDILHNLSTKHLVMISEMLKKKFPQEKHDFTRIFPRVLTLYVFSFLDPRTLCRCAQVSWYWNYLTELDCLWRPKCLKFGWYPVSQPSSFEEKVWKRFYVTTVYDLNYAKAKPIEKKQNENVDIKPPDTSRSAVSQVSIARSSFSSTSGLRRGPSTPSPKKPLAGPKWEPPPWKGSDKKPTDTFRYNYLDNKNKSSRKKTGSPSDSRPDSQQGHRPRSSAHLRAQECQSPMPGASDGRNSARRLATADSAARTTEFVTPEYSTGLSPRLNKNFRLPLYNDLGASPPGDRRLNESLQQKENLNPTQNQTSSPHDRNPFLKREASRTSIDAGKMPSPARNFERTKIKPASPSATQEIVKEYLVDTKIVTAKANQSMTTNNLNELKGTAWQSKTHEESDED